MKLLRTSVFLLLLVLMLPMAAASQLGDSLSLEGRTAVIRGSAWLLSRQEHDGTWNNGDIATTALAGLALHASAPLLASAECPYSPERISERIWKRSSVAPCEDALRLRLELTIGPSVSKAVMAHAFVRLSSISDCSPETAPWIADALAQCARHLHQPIPDASLKALHGITPQSLPRQLALSIASKQHTAASLKTLYSAVRIIKCLDASCDDLYWAARSFQACNTAQAIPYDGWKADIMDALLTRQHGDGSWHTASASPQETVRDTALAILTAILCLAD